MTTSLELVDGTLGETPNEATSRRIRQELAGKKRPVAQVALAAKAGMKQQALSRRLLGDVPWDLNEIYAVCDAAEIDVLYVLTGRREAPRPSPGGGSSAPLNGNNGDLGLKVRSSTTELKGLGAEVYQFPEAAPYAPVEEEAA